MNEYLVLSLLESIYLIDKGYISIKNSKTGRMVTLTGLKKLYKRIEKNLTERIIAYKELRENGVLVKTGFKYGSHFRCYSSDPNTSHAKYLIHVVPDNYVTIWPEISRAVRLAHGVKKELILAVVGKDEKITYIHIERTRL
jgi:tRNA-intron endonuclease